MFDASTYFETLTNSLVVTKDKYHFSKVSGLSEMEGVLSNRKHHQFHIAVDISESGILNRGQGRGFFDRRPYTVFICAAVSDFNDMDAKAAMMEEFRQIYRSFVTKIIKDASEDGLMLFDTQRIPYYEIPGEFAAGCVGIYFIVSVDNQIDLSYNAGDWS